MGFGHSFHKAFKKYIKHGTHAWERLGKGLGSMIGVSESYGQEKARKQAESDMKAREEAIAKAKRETEAQAEFDKEQARLTAQFQAEQDIGARQQEQRYDFSKVLMGDEEEEDEEDILTKYIAK